MIESTLYRRIFQEGEARGEARGKARGEAKGLIKLLVARLGLIPPHVSEFILEQAKDNPETVSLWFNEAILATETHAAEALLRKIVAV